MELVSGNIATLVFVNKYSPFLWILSSQRCLSLSIVSFVIRRKNHRAECQA